jgi:hypothetical protein
MGGYAGIGRDVAGAAFGSLKELATSPEVREQAKNLGGKLFRSLGSSFDKDDIGKDLKGLMTSYHKNLDVAKSTIMQQEATRPYHPKIPAMSSKDIAAQAKVAAATQTFGKNHALVAGYIGAAQKYHGRFRAQELANNIAMMLNDEHEATLQSDKNKSAAPMQVKVSRGLENISKNKTYQNELKSLSKTSGAANAKPIDISSVRSKQSNLETSLINHAVRVFAPLMVIPHLSTPINASMRMPVMALAKGMADSLGKGSYAETQEMLAHTGIMAESSMRAIKSLEQVKNGQIVKLEKGSLAARLNKLFVEPGFAGVRKWTTVFAGASAYHGVPMMAEKFLRTGSETSRNMLEELGVDTKALKERPDGKLTDQEMDNAIWHFVNKRVFLHTELNRSYLANSNGFFRVGTLFHNYVSSQGGLILHEAKMAAKSGLSGDITDLAKTAFILGVVFPTSGFAVQELKKTFSNPAHPPDVIEDAEDQIDNGPQHFAESYLEDYAQTAGFGIAFDYMQSALKNRLASEALGPIVNAGISDVQGVAGLGKSIFSDKPGINYAPVTRDVLEQTLPLGIGKIISHMFFPTQAEQRKQKKEEDAGDVPFGSF